MLKRIGVTYLSVRYIKFDCVESFLLSCQSVGDILRTSWQSSLTRSFTGVPKHPSNILLTSADIKAVANLAAIVVMTFHIPLSRHK